MADPELITTHHLKKRRYSILSEYAKFARNVQQRVVVEFNQMSGRKLDMSGEALNNFTYSAI